MKRNIRNFSVHYNLTFSRSLINWLQQNNFWKIKRIFLYKSETKLLTKQWIMRLTERPNSKRPFWQPTWKSFPWKRKPSGLAISTEMLRSLKRTALMMSIYLRHSASRVKNIEIELLKKIWVLHLFKKDLNWNDWSEWIHSTATLIAKIVS